MTSCTNEEPRYFGTKTCHVKANAFTIQTVGVYVPPRVPLLFSRCRPSKHVSRREACEQTDAPAVREAFEQTAVQAHREAPFDQAPPPTFVPNAPTFNGASAAV